MATTPTTDNLTLNLTLETLVRASMAVTFESVIAQMGRLNETPDGKPLPMVIEPWPGGRWYRDLGGEQLIEWSGALRWLVAGERTEPATVRAWARDHGGHAMLFRATEKSAGAFHPLPDTLHTLHRRLKATFDPAGILNRGRLYPDF